MVQLFHAAVAVAIFSVLVIWSLVAYESAARLEEQGSPVLTSAVMALYGIAPVLFWMVGTHQPVADYAKIPRLPNAQGAMGRVLILTLFLLLGVAVVILLSRSYRLVLRGRALWIAYLGFASGPVLAMEFGTHPRFRYTFLLAPAAFTVVYLSLRGSPDRWMAMIRRLLLLYVWTSIGLALARPAWAFDAYSRSTLLLGASPRLTGITAHPNTLGAVAATAVLVVATTSVGRWRLINCIGAGAALVLTDSRMAIAGTLGGLLLTFIHSREGGHGLRVAMAVSLIIAPALWVTSANEPMERLAAISDGSLTSSQVSTVSGRAAVWEQTVVEWRDNRLFGFGPGLWSPDHRRQFGQRFNWVGQAHNQWFQSLGDAGLVGLAGLVIYVGALIRAAFLTSTRSRGLTGALVTLLLFRIMSESALRNPGLDVITMLHLVTFAVLIAYSTVDNHASDSAEAEHQPLFVSSGS